MRMPKQVIAIGRITILGRGIAKAKYKMQTKVRIDKIVLARLVVKPV